MPQQLAIFERGARSSSEIEVRGEIRLGSRRGKAIHRSRPRLGQRHRQLRPVGPNRLSDALSLRLSILLTRNPSNQFTKRSEPKLARTHPSLVWCTSRPTCPTLERMRLTTESASPVISASLVR